MTEQEDQQEHSVKSQRIQAAHYQKGVNVTLLIREE
jgi:hypothetical protein